MIKGHDYAGARHGWFGEFVGDVEGLGKGEGGCEEGEAEEDRCCREEELHIGLGSTVDSVLLFFGGLVVCLQWMQDGKGVCVRVSASDELIRLIRWLDVSYTRR